ncbi:MAG: HEPN domain-containing protein [Actinomycetota bacterium]
MTPAGRRIAVARYQAASHLAKAVQFLDAARSASESSHHDATLLNAIHAAISATDAVCIALAGMRSTDPDHLRAADLLDEIAGKTGAVGAHARQLRQLLSRKNVVEYESRRATLREGTDALARATRLLDWARDVVTSARL